MTLPLILRTVLIAETLDAPVTAGLEKAAAAYAKVIRKKPQDLLDLGLAAFNPALSADSELLTAPEKMLYDKAPAISSLFKDRPVALVRAVIILALYDLLSDQQLGSLLYLALVDTLHAQHEPVERVLRSDFIDRARATYLVAAETAWDAPIIVHGPSKKGSGKRSSTASAVIHNPIDADVLNQHIKNALNNGHNLNAYGMDANWANTFAARMATALAESIDNSVRSMANSINTNLLKTVTTLEEKLEEFQTTEEHKIRQEREAKILWWLQVKYSPAQERPYRELDVMTGAAQLTLDFQPLIPEPVPPHVEAVITEAVRSTYPDADQVYPLWLTLQALTTLRGLTATPATRTLWAWTGRTANAAEFELATGVKADTSITPVALALWLFRQAQAERLT